MIVRALALETYGESAKYAQKVSSRVMGKSSGVTGKSALVSWRPIIDLSEEEERGGLEEG